MLEAQSTGPKYPDVEVQLTGGDGNAFAIIAAVRRALIKDVGPEAAQDWMRDSMDCASYDDLLALAQQTVEVA